MDFFSNEREEGRQSFIMKFPFEKLKKLTIDEYILQSNNYPDKYKYTFFYWLERRRTIGGIGGGNASKSYIYMDATGQYCTGFGIKKSYLEGQALEYEFKTLRDKIVKAIELEKEDKVNMIKDLEVPISNMALLKILCIYIPEKFSDVFSSSCLLPLAETLDLVLEIDASNIIEINYEATKKLREYEEFR